MHTKMYLNLMFGQMLNGNRRSAQRRVRVQINKLFTILNLCRSFACQLKSKHNSLRHWHFSRLFFQRWKHVRRFFCCFSRRLASLVFRLWHSIEIFTWTKMAIYFRIINRNLCDYNSCASMRLFTIFSMHL